MALLAAPPFLMVTSMSINEYRSEILKLIRAMEEEHGCVVRSLKYEMSWDESLYYSNPSLRKWSMSIEIGE